VEILFNEKVSQAYDKWFETKKGLLVDSLEKELILKIADLKRAESLFLIFQEEPFGAFLVVGISIR